MTKIGLVLPALVVLAMATLLFGSGVVPLSLAARIESASSQAEGAPALSLHLTSVMADGTITYSAQLENSSSQQFADVNLAVPVPPDLIALRATATPNGSTFAAFGGGVAVWHLDRVAANSTVGPFSYRGTATGATPAPLSASARWTSPQSGTATSESIRPTMAGLPSGTVPVSGVVSGVGERWANPGDLPVGPYYGVYAGRIISLEYMVSQADFAQGANHAPLAGNQGLPPIDHVDIQFEPNGSEGYPIPHYDIQMYMVPHAQHEAIKP